MEPLFKGVLMPPNTSARNYGCWAKGCGCAGEITKEHVISSSILNYFKSLSLDLGNKKIKVGPGNFFIRNLCKHHNNLLSPFDNEALKLFSGWKRIVTNNSAGITNKKALEHHLYIDIDHIEKWFAKTFINIVLFKQFAKRQATNIACLHPKPTAERIFSNDSFKPPFGIYMINPETPLDPNRHPWTFSEQYTKIFKKDNNSGNLTEYKVPSSIYVSMGGIELMGFFNITQFDDEYALATILKSTADGLRKKGWYRQKIAVSGGSGCIQHNSSPNGHLIFVKSDTPDHPLTSEALRNIKEFDKGSL